MGLGNQEPPGEHLTVPRADSILTFKNGGWWPESASLSFQRAADTFSYNQQFKNKPCLVAPPLYLHAFERS